MAEMTDLLHNLEEEVTCPICQDNLKTPKILTCLHAFCCECLKQFAEAHKKQQERKNEKQPLRCPTCQDEIRMPEGGSFDDLPTSFHHNSLAAIVEIYDKRKLNKLCVSCDKQKKVGDFYCFECGHLCEDCYQLHRSLKGLKCHEVLQVKDKDISEQDIQALKQKQAVCKEKYHSDEPLRYYCLECHLSLCQICITADKKHKNHEIQFLEETADKLKRDISAYIDQLLEKQQAFVTRIENIKIAKENLMASTQDAKRTIQKTCERLRTNLLLHEQKALKQLDLLSVGHDKILRHDENSTIENLRKINDILDLTDRLLQKGTAFETIQTQEVIENRVKEVTAGTERGNPFVAEILTFFPNDKNIQTLDEDKVDFLGVLISYKQCDPKRSVLDLSEVENFEATKEESFVVELRSADGRLCSNKQDLEEITVQIAILNEVQKEESSSSEEEQDQEQEQEQDEAKEEENERQQQEIIMQKEEADNNKNKMKEVIVNHEIHQREDGKYQVVFTPPFYGYYKAHVQIRGQDVSNSPYTFLVKPKHFKNSMTLTSKMLFDGKPLESPSGVAVSKHGFVAVCDCGNSRVLLFDDQLNYVRQIGKKGTAKGQFTEPYAVAFDHENRLVVADRSNNTVQFFMITGKFVKRWSKISDYSLFDEPTGLFLDENNRLVVCDCCDIQIFDSEGVTQKTLKPLQEPFNCIVFHELYVFSSLDKGLCFCNGKGKIEHLFDCNGPDVVGRPKFQQPTGLAITQTGCLLVCDQLSGEVWLMSPERKLIGKYGNEVELVKPLGVAAFIDGRVIVTEPSVNRIQVLI